MYFAVGICNRCNSNNLSSSREAWWLGQEPNPLPPGSDPDLRFLQDRVKRYDLAGGACKHAFHHFVESSFPQPRAHYMFRLLVRFR